MSEMYPDSNGNGVPDAFENRLPLSEILNAEEEETIPVEPKARQTTLILELEVGERPAKEGELYFLGGTVQRQNYSGSTVCVTIVKYVLASPPDWEPL